MTPATKGEGIIRLIYENANRFSNRLSDNEKIDKAKEIHDELNVDIAAYCKHRLNMRNKHNINRFNQLFKGGEAAIQSVVAHNTHKNIGRVQEGGTSLLLFGPLTKQLTHDEPGKDESGLKKVVSDDTKGRGIPNKGGMRLQPLLQYKTRK